MSPANDGLLANLYGWLIGDRLAFRRWKKSLKAEATAKQASFTVDGHGTFKGQPFTYGRGVPDFSEMVWAGVQAEADRTGAHRTIIGAHIDRPHLIRCTCGWWHEDTAPEPTADQQEATAKRHAETHASASQEPQA